MSDPAATGGPAVPRELTLRHSRGETAIVAGRGAWRAARARLAEWVAGRTLFVVTTPRVAELWGERVEALGASAARAVRLEVEEGEEAKRLHRASALWQEMLAAGGKRDSRLIALGGGSVNDLGGFVAGCFLRGIEVVQAPTTLLAQVDAAIGGKTAVDLPAAKNTVGVFHHPTMVVADVEVLATLPRDEIRSGLAEVVKMAYLLDASLFERLEALLERLIAGDQEALELAVIGGAAAKVGVVERDAEETDERKLLNFGHTLGHAIEAAAGYGVLRHGDAVSYGMLFALRLARRRGLAEADAERLRRLLTAFGLPPLPELGAERLLEAMRHDKKARESGLAWVLPTALGYGRVATDVGFDEVAAELPAFLASPFS